MRIVSAVLMGSLVAVAGGVLYDTTFEVQEMEGELNRLNRQIVAEREVIQVLKADWSVLNDIARIEQLSLRHLPELRPAEAQQFASLKTIAVRGRGGAAETGLASLPGKPAAAVPAAVPVAVPVKGALPLPTAQPPGDGIGSLISKVGSGR